MLPLYIGRFVKKLEELSTDLREDDAGDSLGATLADVNSRTLVKQVLVQGDRVMKPADGVTVLIYHRVGGGSGGEVDLDVDAFRAQLEHLRTHHTVIDLDPPPPFSPEAPVGDRHCPSGPSWSPSTTGPTTSATWWCRHWSTTASPPPCTPPPTSSTAGRPFPWGAPPASWAGLRDAASTGYVTIGSHTHTHALLDRADPAEIGAELDRSIELIGEHIGTPPAHFAYPKALPGSEAAEAEVRRRFTTAALARSRVNEPGTTDLHRLWRTPIQRSDGHDFFVAKAAGGLRLEGELRDLVARIKYRGATR